MSGINRITSYNVCYTKLLRWLSRTFSLGDTFEVYAKMNGTLEDIE